MRNQLEKREDLLGKKLDLLLKTGQLLIQCLADSNRIDRNMRRIALFMGIPSENFQMHITYTTLMINVSEGSHSLTKFRKCTGHGVNMEIISGISNLSLEAIEKNYTLEQYEKCLNKITSGRRNYPRWLVIILIGLACGGFCKLFGCDWPAVGITAIAAATALFARQEMHHRNFNLYLTVSISAFIATLIAGTGFLFNLSQTPNHPFFASVLFLIPGVPLINCIDDMIDGYTIVGVTRAVIAFFTIGAISFGMIFALKLLGHEDYGAILTPRDSWGIIALAAAAAAGGFAVLFNVPRHTLLICAFGGAIAVVTRNFLQYQFGLSLPLATFCGALVIGTIANFVIRPLHVPAKVVAVPPVIAMVPGVLMYRAMIGLLEMNNIHGVEQLPTLLQTMSTGIQATITILCISLGVAIPLVIGRRYFDKGNQRLLKKAVLENQKE